MAQAPNRGTELVKWVALPRGVSDGNLLMTVLVAPELTPSTNPGTLLDFISWSNWPNQLAARSPRFGFAVAFVDDVNTSNAAVNVVATNVTVQAPDPAVWQALFPSTTPVIPRTQSDNPDPTIETVSYPGQPIVEFLTGPNGQYSGLISPSPGRTQSPPSIGQTGGSYGGTKPPHGETQEDRIAALKAERLTPDAGGNVSYSNKFTLNTPLSDALAAHAEYFDRGAASQPAAPNLDFHAALSFVHEHFLLQRLLGVAIDLSVPISKVPFLANGDSNFLMVIYPAELNSDGMLVGDYPFPGGGYSGFNVPCRCSYTTSPPAFEAWNDPQADLQVGSGELGTGTSGQTGGQYTYTVDLVGGAARASAFAVGLTQAQQEAELYGLLRALPLSDWRPPGLRSKGLSLAVWNWGQIVQQQIQDQASLFNALQLTASREVPSPLPAVTGPDIVRGLILDVFDQQANGGAGKWYSTNARQITYTSPTSAFNPYTTTDEGGVSTSVNSAEQNGQTTYYISEEILSYNGWSNAVGTVAAGGMDDADTTGLPAPGANVFADRIAIGAVVPPGSLPRLRFGRKYKLRARTVDLANNAIALGSGGTEGVSAPIIYGRLEPIPSPDVYPQNSVPNGYPLAAEGPLRMVIRDKDVKADPAASSTRVLAPPRCTVPFAEVHGMFDTGPPPGDGSQTNTLDPNAWQVWAAPVPDAFNPGATVPRESGHYPLPPAVWQSGIDVTQPVPYLPDPLARGGIIALEFGTSGKEPVATWQFDPGSAAASAWPNYKPVLLTIQDGAGGARGVSLSGQTLTVLMEPGDTLTGVFNCTCYGTDVADFGLGSIFSGVSASTISTGLLWAITPAAHIKLVYAVQQPLVSPDLSEAFSYRDPGNTYAIIGANLTWDPGTTGKFDLLAQWTDPVDEPNGPGNTQLTVNGTTYTVPGVIAGPGVPDSPILEPTSAHVWSTGDTLGEGEEPPAEPGGAGISETLQDMFRGVVHEFHDTKAHNVTYQVVATSLFTEYYPEDDPSALTRAGATSTTQIQASAQPAALSIAFVVPIFDWSSSTNSAGTTTSTRSGTGLRVFLERPWWSSGADELLAVVVSGYTDIEPDYGAFDSVDARYWSDWGIDPVFAGGDLPQPHPDQAAFPAAVFTSDDNAQGDSILGIGGDPNRAAFVAGHAVSFDPTLNLWYSDIEINTGAAYAPMIRLALARFQPNAPLNNYPSDAIALGPITPIDIFTLDQSRIATVQSNRDTLTVTLTGRSYTGAEQYASKAPGVMQVLLQQQDASVSSDPELGWSVPSGVAPVVVDGSIKSGIATWKATVGAPGRGGYRLLITQYEVVPTDDRGANLGQLQEGYRLVHQDVVPVTVRGLTGARHPKKPKHPAKGKPKKKKK